jgi:hypothetical protein
LLSGVGNAMFMHVKGKCELGDLPKQCTMYDIIKVGTQLEKRAEIKFSIIDAMRLLLERVSSTAELEQAIDRIGCEAAAKRMGL